jgi:hypothetical protein
MNQQNVQHLRKIEPLVLIWTKSPVGCAKGLSGAALRDEYKGKMANRTSDPKECETGRKKNGS